MSASSYIQSPAAMRALKRVEKIKAKLNEAQIELEALCNHQFSHSISHGECKICGASEYYSDEHRMKLWQDLKTKKQAAKAA